MLGFSRHSIGDYSKMGRNYLGLSVVPLLLGFSSAGIAATSPAAVSRLMRNCRCNLSPITVPIPRTPASSREDGDTRLFLTDNGAVFVSRNGDKSSEVRMQMRGANPHPRAEALDTLPGVSNYFMGKDSRQWRTNLPTFQRVMYHDAWPGIDMRTTETRASWNTTLSSIPAPIRT